ncbi:hypothetical protein G7076_11985 [Sphingomonas sp. HDW15A]|uniref:hypothetical protein n=1 Tax=Sphingomonas sp. HDW15A TaxID=2714942 RepID=UPI001407FCB5|nr:hypothetical protein [Sphingomonas sp. HDW15A]QIK97043.1 hypothetical protein G7076_11985 [Sphingomonas sp. HDW15A]
MGGPKPAKDARVTVNVTDVAADKFQFQSNDLPVGKDNHITFDNVAGYNGFNVYFQLQGADGYRFPDDLEEALYVKGGSSTYCPQSKSTWGQFEAVDVLDNGRTLKVWNKNDAKAKFAYTLIAKKTGEKDLIMDPGGTNNNGGGTSDFAFSSNVVVGAVAAAALLAVAFIVLR